MNEDDRMIMYAQMAELSIEERLMIWLAFGGWIGALAGAMVFVLR